MRRTFALLVIGLIGPCFVSGPTTAMPATGKPDQIVLLDFSRESDMKAVEARNAKCSKSDSKALRVEIADLKPSAGVAIKAPQGKWDLSRYANIALELKNLGSRPATLACRIESADTSGGKQSISESAFVEGGKSAILRVRLSTEIHLTSSVQFIGMRGNPVQPSKIDPSNIAHLFVYAAGGTGRTSEKPGGQVFEITKIRAEGVIRRMKPEKFFPFIDEYGQFIHKNWPGKTHSQKDLIARLNAEEKDLAARPGPLDRNKYGGWTAGPKLKATGFFRVEKYQGKWWLVDPDGCLFWSHGIDCVRMRNTTPITDRERYFRDLPSAGSPFAQFYDFGRFAAHGYYEKMAQYKTYDFARANLLRKYGRDWAKVSAQLAHKRLRSWGMNTIGNWSESDVYLLRNTPYTATIRSQSRKIEGSQGFWGKFDDVFDPGFRASLRRYIAEEKTTTADDPWCIGYFVHNELSWGDDLSLAMATLISPEDQPAKKVFVADLRAKYGAIEKLNAAWQTNYESWDALLKSTVSPDKEKARDDLAAFYTKIAETYFKTIRDEVKAVAPNHLYLGCRFAWVNDRAARAAAKFCDVVSYNRYSYSVSDLRLPGGLDMPTIIGEWHFGALDRGMFHPGLRLTADQNDRAAKYEGYVRGALENPYVVGTHWFQYQDQATTGRSDGENYQIGFVDICDTPYPETIRACREVGYALYEYRLGAK